MCTADAGNLFSVKLLNKTKLQHQKKKEKKILHLFMENKGPALHEIIIFQ